MLPLSLCVMFTFNWICSTNLPVYRIVLYGVVVVLGEMIYQTVQQDELQWNMLHEPRPLKHLVYSRTKDMKHFLLYFWLIRDDRNRSWKHWTDVLEQRRQTCRTNWSLAPKIINRMRRKRCPIHWWLVYAPRYINEPSWRRCINIHALNEWTTSNKKNKMRK